MMLQTTFYLTTIAKESKIFSSFKVFLQKIVGQQPKTVYVTK